MTETVAKTGVFTLNPTPATPASSESVVRTGTLTLNPLPVSSGQRVTVSGAFTLYPVLQQVTRTGRFTLNPASATVVAGPSVTVDAGDRFTLTAQTETPAAGTTIVSRVWRLNGVVVGTSRSVDLRAPITRAGTTITPTYSVTDSSGATTPPSPLAVTVRPANIRTGGGRPIVRRTGGGSSTSAPPAGYGTSYGTSYGS